MSITILFWCVFYILLCRITLYLFYSFSCINIVLVPMFIIQGLLNTPSLVLYGSKNRLKICERFLLLDPWIAMQGARLTAVVPFYRIRRLTFILIAILGKHFGWNIGYWKLEEYWVKWLFHTGPIRKLLFHTKIDTLLWRNSFTKTPILRPAALLLSLKSEL